MNSRNQYEQPRLGAVYGRLTITAVDAGRDRDGNRTVRCKCFCGRRNLRRQFRCLRWKRTRSCGCLARELRLLQSKKSRTAERRAHRDMLRRCYELNNRLFRSYGAIGIVVCSRWRGKNGFAHWLKDIGRKPKPYAIYSISRYLDLGGYTCGKKSCRECTKNGWACNAEWGTHAQQAAERMGHDAYRRIHRWNIYQQIVRPRVEQRRRKALDRKAA
jgi:hypothetical protein